MIFYCRRFGFGPSQGSRHGRTTDSSSTIQIAFKRIGTITQSRSTIERWTTTGARNEQVIIVGQTWNDIYIDFFVSHLICYRQILTVGHLTDRFNISTLQFSQTKWIIYDETSYCNLITVWVCVRAYYRNYYKNTKKSNKSSKVICSYFV